VRTAEAVRRETAEMRLQQAKTGEVVQVLPMKSSNKPPRVTSSSYWGAITLRTEGPDTIDTKGVAICYLWFPSEHSRRTNWWQGHLWY
jgi:hypothetical protein